LPQARWERSAFRGRLNAMTQMMTEIERNDALPNGSALARYISIDQYHRVMV